MMSEVAVTKPLLTPYNYTLHEPLAVKWFFDMQASGDLAKVVFTDLHYLGNFLHFAKNDVKMGFAADEQGIWFAGWGAPFLSGLSTGMWIREDKRHTKSALRAVYEFLDAAFNLVKVIVGFSKQSYLQGIHEKLGYKLAEDIPFLWGDESVQAYYLTKEAYHNRRYKRHVNEQR